VLATASAAGAGAENGTAPSSRAVHEALRGPRADSQMTELLTTSCGVSSRAEARQGQNSIPEIHYITFISLPLKL